jgi:hypothetical protein
MAAPITCDEGIGPCHKCLQEDIDKRGCRRNLHRQIFAAIYCEPPRAFTLIADIASSSPCTDKSGRA